MKSDILRCGHLHAWYKIQEMHNGVQLENKRKPKKPQTHKEPWNVQLTMNYDLCKNHYRTNSVRLFGVGEGQFSFWDISAEQNKKQ